MLYILYIYYIYMCVNIVYIYMYIYIYIKQSTYSIFTHNSEYYLLYSYVNIFLVSVLMVFFILKQGGLNCL